MLNVGFDAVLILTEVSTDLQVLLHGQVVKNPASFRHQGDAFGHNPLGALAGNVPSVIHNAAGTGTYQSADGAQGGRLTSTIGTDQGNNFPFFHLEGNAPQGINAAIVHVKIRYFQQTHSSSTPR